MNKTFRLWTAGDQTVGDGQLQAKVELDMPDDEEMIRLAKDSLVDAFAKMWDTAARRIFVMTEEEYDEYTSDHDNDG